MSPSDSELLRLMAAGMAAGAAPGRLLMQLALIAPSQTALEQALEQADRFDGQRAADLRRLWRETPDAWATVQQVLRVLRRVEAAGLTGVDRWRTVYDQLAPWSPEAAVALYSLGRPDLLAAATAEIADWMIGTGLVPDGGVMLDLGCGHGRFCVAFAHQVRLMIGLDISEGMLAEARRACAGLDQVALLCGTGRDLACLADGCCDLVQMIDSFPHIVDLGDLAVRRYLQEIFRVLRPGGRLLILNYSNQGDDAANRRDLRRLADHSGFRLLVNGGSGPDQWEGCVFLLGKPG